MPRFKVTVYREWKETGEIEVDADDEDTARDEAEEALNSGDDGIDWQSSNMEPGNQGVECVEEI